jgi:hypothetical protein
MRGIKATKLLIAPLLVAPMLVAGFAFSQAASAAPKIVCSTLSGGEATGSTITEGGCTGGPAGSTSATSTNGGCTKCTSVQSWVGSSPAETSTDKYKAKLTTGMAAETKCGNVDDTILAVETGKITAGFGKGGKSKADVCVNTTAGTLSLEPGTKGDL